MITAAGWAFNKIESQDAEHAKMYEKIDDKFAKKDELTQLSNTIHIGFDKIEKGFMKIDDNFTGLDEKYARKIRVSSLYSMINNRFEKTNDKIDNINEYLRDKK